MADELRRANDCPACGADEESGCYCPGGVAKRVACGCGYDGPAVGVTCPSCGADPGVTSARPVAPMAVSTVEQAFVMDTIGADLTGGGDGVQTALADYARKRAEMVRARDAWREADRVARGAWAELVDECRNAQALAARAAACVHPYRDEARRCLTCGSQL